MDKSRGISTRINILQGFTNQIRLIGRLMIDRRVNPLLKLLPVGALVYLVVPTDLMPMLPFDDAAVLWIGATLFLDLCPPEIVSEHRLAIEARDKPVEDAQPPANPPSEDVVDAEFYEVNQPEHRQ